MVSIEFSEGITETLDILNHMSSSDVNKISKKFMDFLERNKSKDYVPNLDHSKKLYEMDLKQKTKAILATIYLNYWCDEEQKEEYTKILKENEKKYQKELREKYSTDNIFKRNNIQSKEESVIQDNVSIMEYKESVFKKIINKIKKIFCIT
ncbi:MAG: hypothetical protein IJK18_05055 [Clostridia bacterium]|nr:hypothetical protein [Clostridia bacterium]